MRERDNLWKARAEVNADRLWRGADGAHVKLRDMTDDRIDFSLMLVLRSELQSQQPWAESFRMERERRGMPPIDPIEKRHAAVETAIVLILRDAREDDAKVKVKASPENRKHGIRVSGGHVYAGEVGSVARQDGIGWWDWNIIFSQGRKMRLDAETLEQIKPLKRTKEDA